jgi:hypothetical protein
MSARLQAIGRTQSRAAAATNFMVTVCCVSIDTGHTNLFVLRMATQEKIAVGRRYPFKATNRIGWLLTRSSQLLRPLRLLSKFGQWVLRHTVFVCCQTPFGGETRPAASAGPSVC